MIRSIRGIAAWAGAVLVLTTAFVRAADPPQKVATVEGITEYRLSNGLRVLLFPDASTPKVTVNLTVFVGSRHEGYGETGMAHLLEHMVFKGTPKMPDVNKELRDHGAEFNGSTWVDRTNYYETLDGTDENLEFAIRMEADRMVNSFIKREDLASEMTVVRNEFEQGENSPTSILLQRIRAVAYEWHNYGKSTIGNRSDIERVPIDKLQAFYKKHYQPDNAMLVIAGKFDPAKALEYVNKYFGALPKTGAGAGENLHRRTAAGRRALGDAASGRHRRRGWRRLPHPLGVAPRLRPAGRAQHAADDAAVRSFVPGVGDDEEGNACQRFGGRLPRPRPAGVHGPGRPLRLGRGRPRRDARRAGKAAPGQVHRGGGRARP